MSKRRFYITTAIPYVNGDPHIGFALECVQADVLARLRRLRGEDVRFLSETDVNSLKNVEAAETAGLPVATHLDSRPDTDASSMRGARYPDGSRATRQATWGRSSAMRPCTTATGGRHVDPRKC